jgi:hypothetical protein
MNKPHKKSDDAAPQTTHESSAPTSDSTNPHNQEPAGDWVANERAAERKNNEPGLTDEERKRRRW